MKEAFADRLKPGHTLTFRTSIGKGCSSTFRWFRWQRNGCAKRSLLFTRCTLLLLSTATQAATISGVEIPETRGNLHLHGAGVLRKGLVFRIYAGALYVATDREMVSILSNVPKRLDIHYYHNTPKKRMISVATATLKKNLSAADYEALRPKIDQLHQAFVDGPKGGFASLIHHPGQGLSYEVNGKHIITIQGDDFANAYFNVWLGTPPSSTSMKKSLLTKWNPTHE